VVESPIVVVEPPEPPPEVESVVGEPAVVVEPPEPVVLGIPVVPVDTVVPVVPNVDAPVVFVVVEPEVGVPPTVPPLVPSDVATAPWVPLPLVPAGSLPPLQAAAIADTVRTRVG
jgi:hypothetical protein